MKSVIYHPSTSNFKYMAMPLFFMFIGTNAYSLSISSHLFASILFYMSFIYLIVLATSYLQTIPKWNYIELGPDGIRVKSLGFAIRLYAWQNIKSFRASGGGKRSLVIGIEYEHPLEFTALYWWRQQVRKRMFGYYDLIANSYDTGDKELFKILVQWHRKYTNP